MLFSFAVLCSAFVSCILDLHLGHTFLSLSHFIPLQFNWYTRRAVLTGVYNTTELVMMQDSSPDFEDTWRFLENRVADAMNMGNTANQVQSTGEALVQGLMGAAVTVSNAETRRTL